jgi:RNA polymerase sigma-70 factor (ECF subfamily)
MQAVARGDLEAFEQIVRRHQDRAWRIACRFLGREEDAADVVQDAFIRLLGAAARYQPTASFTTYLHTIVARLCLDHAKKKRPLSLEEVPESEDPHPSAIEDVARRETRIAVRAALDDLPPNQRMAIVLRYFEDQGYEEIASALGSTPKAVERLLARGRDRLRATLGSQLENLRP